MAAGPAKSAVLGSLAAFGFYWVCAASCGWTISTMALEYSRPGASCWSPPTFELYRGLDYRELGVRGTVGMNGFWTGADYTDYTEAERREEAGLRPMR